MSLAPSELLPSCLLPPASCLLPPASCRLSPVSYLLSPVPIPPLRTQLLRLLLLLRRQQRIDLAVKTRLLNGELRLRLPQLLHGGSNAPFVNRYGLDRLATGLFRLTHRSEEPRVGKEG